MISNYESKVSKTYFALFSKEDITIFESLIDTELKDLLMYLVKIFNNGMHNQNNGWYGKLLSAGENRLEIMNDTDKLVIQESAKRYIEIANILQKPRYGTNETFFFTRVKKQVIQYTRVYQDCWSRLYEATFHAWLTEISRLPADTLKPRKNKIYLYTLLEFKKSNNFESFLNPNKLQKLFKTIDIVIEGILQKTALSKSFYLTEAEKTESIRMRSMMMNRVNDLNHLRKIFESRQLYAKYIHIRPNILIQYCQVIDFLLLKFADSFVEGQSLLSSALKAPIKHPAWKILSDIRQDFLVMLQFQDLLLKMFGSDDFIEVLHRSVSNLGTGFLPVARLFEFEQSLDIRLIQYASDDKDAPLPITYPNQYEWRNRYLAMHEMKPLQPRSFSMPTLFKEKKQSESKKIINVQHLYLVKQLEAFSIHLPTLLLDRFYPLFEKGNLAFQQQALLVDFFIANNSERCILLEVNDFADVLHQLSRQVNHKSNIHFLSSKQSFQFGLSESVMTNLTGLLAIIKLFTEPYNQELAKITDALAQNKSSNQCEIFHDYKNLLLNTEKVTHRQIETILYYWMTHIVRTVNFFPAQSSLFIDLLLLLDQAINCFNVAPLQHQWNVALAEMKMPNLRDPLLFKKSFN